LREHPVGMWHKVRKEKEKLVGHRDVSSFKKRRRKKKCKIHKVHVRSVGSFVFGHIFFRF